MRISRKKLVELGFPQTAYFAQKRVKALRERQEGRCAICGDEGGLVVDHDHGCCPRGRYCEACIRGLLCSRCNSGLGFFRDNGDLLIRAMGYLRRWEERPIRLAARQKKAGEAA